MNQSDFIATLRRVTEALEQTKLTYHLTGGLVSSYFGEPRLTQDIDVVVSIEPSEAEPFFSALSAQFLVDRSAIEEAVGRHGLFQALDNETFIKVDFHVHASVRGELQRSVTKELFDGLSVPIASKCDAIVSKLLWIREGSGKSRADVIGMLRDPEPVDEVLLDELTTEHGVSDILAELRRELDR